MQAVEQNLELVFPPEVIPASYTWNILSSAQQENSSMDVLDLFLASPSRSPVLDESHTRKQSDINMAQDIFSYPMANDFTSGQSSVSYASSVQSDDFWTAEGTASEVPELPSTITPANSTTVDRRHRRREQNRKAQSNFRQKRKEEVRSLQREVEELRAQLAAYHRRGPTANLTICTKCRTFYPAAVADASHDSNNADLFS
ncbi:hypothetical protein G647_09147 [Cladophialophora carrionii CBS 160.54]|uniref:BZIP domain-containing protein n=1 Tax=Cladophialophora carrionii CBS 160.54 TaxID=1279043 RepID=V9CXF3_9EURO|nr:uncharacterized protein G647_09147 [Cladophialophora carrionii CBS 160.54]ETI19315.1 hypothetical protein G647_09147 [Cladophialophora carrionii CBS 160.54]